MKRIILFLILALNIFLSALNVSAQERRPIDNQHPMWLIHVDVWNKADPQKIIDLIPDTVKPYVVMNLSLSCQYDTEKNVYKMPQNAVKTYKSWGTVCQQNGMWFTCQPASGGHTHIQDNDLETFEYFYKRFPNFLGWNYAEQFWGFDEPNDKSSSSQASRIALFAKLVPMAHKYGGFLTVSFCGNIWSHPLNPIGMMKRNSDLLEACRKYPEAILWLYKYTTSSCFYNNESVTWSPFISGLAKNYGVRYDNCGWNGALEAILGKNNGKKYPVAAGIGTVMEQTCVNGGAVWDGPELIWTEDFQNLNNTTVNGYTRRNWGLFNGFKHAWLDMFEKIIDGTMYIPSRDEVVDKTKIVVVNNVTSGNDEQKYAAWGDLYDGLYKQTDPFNRGNGQWMDNFCYFKKTGRYGAIPVALELYDEKAKSIPVQVKKSNYTTRWSSQTKKVNDFNTQYPEVSKGDLYVNRYRNQLVTYTPYTYLNKKTTAKAEIPLKYNTCEKLNLEYGKLSSGIIHEYSDHIDVYLNNYRSDTTTQVLDKITVIGATVEPTFTANKRTLTSYNATSEWDEETKTFVLSVKHNCGVDITINCSGEGTDRLTDVVSQVALEKPKQPEPYHGPIIIEAEDMDFTNIKSCVTDPYGWYPSVRGHAGNGFMDMGTNTNGALRHELKLDEEGDYKIIVRYTNTAKAGNLSISVNGKNTATKLAKTKTNEWVYASIDAHLKSGKNTLYLRNTGGVASYIDNVTYQPVDVPLEKFDINIVDGEHGKVVTDFDSASEGDKVSFSVIPDEGYKLSGWNIIHGNIIITTDDNSFIMPDDFVTIQPIFRDLSLEYNLDFASVLNGTIPTGWKCTQENNEVHQYPNSYSSGARTFSGFTGYQGKALYWRDGSCEYGSQTAYPLTLQPGRYTMTYAMAAWKTTPKYTAKILDSKGKEIASSDAKSATPNANGNTGASVKAAKEYKLEFTVETKGNYIISFVNNDVIGGFDEFLLLECRINKELEETEIKSMNDTMSPQGIYSVEGTKLPTPKKGINIVRMQNGTVKKILY